MVGVILLVGVVGLAELLEANVLVDSRTFVDGGGGDGDGVKSIGGRLLLVAPLLGSTKLEEVIFDESKLDK